LHRVGHAPLEAWGVDDCNQHVCDHGASPLA
jgi:hypothetical protein